jgi:chromosome segregation ATPase
VVTAAEAVWNEVADDLQQLGDQLAAARQQLGGLDGDALGDALTLAEQDHAQLRDVLNGDPLALWLGGQVDTTRITRLRERTAAAVAAVAKLAALRADADARISAVAAAVSAATDARQDAMAARDRAEAKIATAALPMPPELGALTSRLAGAGELKTAGRWTRLASELDLIEKQAADAASQCREVERRAAALLDRREELRGLLDAYQARAARLGGAEDSDLDARYARARDLLWTAPCDLPAATAAVTGYQQAVLALSGRGRRP